MSPAARKPARRIASTASIIVATPPFMFWIP